MDGQLLGAAKLVATDLLQRLEAAKAIGSHHAFLTDGRPNVSLILAASGRRGIDIIINVFVQPIGMKELKLL